MLYIYIKRLYLKKKSFMADKTPPNGKCIEFSHIFNPSLTYSI